MPSTVAVSPPSSPSPSFFPQKAQSTDFDLFFSAVDEDLVKGMVDLLVSSGLKKAGYSYFVIDGNHSVDATCKHCCLTRFCP